MSRARLFLVVLTVMLAVVVGCHRGKPPVAKVTPPPPAPFPNAPTSTPTTVPTPPEPPPVTASPPVTADPYSSAEAINKSGVLKPAFFAYDSDELDEAARQALSEDADLLKKYAGWVVTIEGHCDERGTAEYNLALGDRRALAAKNYLLSLGVPADRLRTVSYGKEFPFDPGHAEASWSKNRRAQLMVTTLK